MTSASTRPRYSASGAWVSRARRGFRTTTVSTSGSASSTSSTPTGTTPNTSGETNQRDAERQPERRRREYASDLFAREALHFIDRHRYQPFFLYFTPTVPHAKFEGPDLGPYAGEAWPEEAKNYAAMVDAHGLVRRAHLGQVEGNRAGGEHAACFSPATTAGSSTTSRSGPWDRCGRARAPSMRAARAFRRSRAGPAR